MSHFKEKHKEYLVKNGIKTEDDLVIYLDILRNTINSPKEDRQMLMDFAWLLINDKTSVSSFFAETKSLQNKNIKELDKAFEGLLGTTPSKEFYNAFKQTTSSPTFMDEVLEQANKEKWNPLNELHERAGREMFNTIKDEDGQFNSTRQGETHTEVPNFNVIDVKQILPKHILDVLEEQEGKRPKVVSESGEKLTFDENFNLQEVGKKEKTGKLHYELSWEFIEEMAKRMANNKSDKYPLYNWKQKINVQDLKDAINRHHVEVMKGNYKDGDEIFGHIVQYACNSMMLWEQLRNKS